MTVTLRAGRAEAGEVSACLSDWVEKAVMQAAEKMAAMQIERLSIRL
jgi:hypothetical protein